MSKGGGNSLQGSNLTSLMIELVLHMGRNSLVGTIGEGGDSSQYPKMLCSPRFGPWQVFVFVIASLFETRQQSLRFPFDQAPSSGRYTLHSSLTLNCSAQRRD